MPPMTVDVIKIIGEVGSIAVLVLVLFGVWKYGGGFVSRLMDNLDQQSENNKAAIVAQQNTSSNLEKMCERMNGHDRATEERNKVVMEALEEIRNALAENTGVLRGLSQTLSKREAQIAKRDAELIRRLEAMNGKCENGGNGGEK